MLRFKDWAPLCLVPEFIHEFLFIWYADIALVPQCVALVSVTAFYVAVTWLIRHS